MKTSVPIKFESFQSLANAFFRTLGSCPYEIHDSPLPKIPHGKLIFYTGMINMNLVALLGVILVITAVIDQKGLMDVLITLICVGFMYTTNIKLFVIILKRDEISALMQNLHKLFPRTLKQQREYEALKYLKLVRRTTVTFSATFVVVGGIYMFYSIGEYVVHKYWLGGNAESPDLIYPVYIPWHWQGHWSYILLFIWQLGALYTGAGGQIAVELLFYSVATQLVMHYDYVGRAIECYTIKAVSSGEHNKKERKQDLKFICQMVAYHNEVLSMSTILNDVFGFSLFLNFACSSVTICFSALLITVDIDIEWRIKLILALIAFVLQIYFITYYGQLLIDASTNVASATFRQNWAEADKRYQKLLSLIIQRAQKPAFLNATNFVRVQQTTMTAIFQVAYKLVCVLRKMFDENKGE